MNDNCKKCVYKKGFQSIEDGEIIFLCMSEPYEEDDQFGITAVLRGKRGLHIDLRITKSNGCTTSVQKAPLPACPLQHIVIS